jgi:hypothetical protein
VGLAEDAVVGVGDDFAGGMVEVTKIFFTKTWTATTMAVGEDVAALEAFDFDGLDG